MRTGWWNSGVYNLLVKTKNITPDVLLLGSHFEIDMFVKLRFVIQYQGSFETQCLAICELVLKTDLVDFEIVVYRFNSNKVVLI